MPKTKKPGALAPGFFYGGGVAGANALSQKRGFPLFPIQPDAGIVTMELVNQLRDESP